MTPERVENELQLAIKQAAEVFMRTMCHPDMDPETMEQHNARLNEFICSYMVAYATLRGARHDA